MQSGTGLAPLVLAAVLGAAVAPQATAQDRPGAATPSGISATAEATVSAQPDLARIDVGVVTQAPSAREAASKNAQLLERVLAAVRPAAGAAAAIKTVSYALSPVHVYPREGGEPTITGYRASNTVRVEMTDLARVGPVIDAATGAGANEIQSLQFTLKDEEATRAQALRDASRSARAKAEAIASALNTRLGRLISAEESFAPVRPVFADAMLARADAAQTPVVPGTVEVRATVRVNYEVVQ
jgi:hypothetical protein